MGRKKKSGRIEFDECRSISLKCDIVAARATGEEVEGIPILNRSGVGGDRATDFIKNALPKGNRRMKLHPPMVPQNTLNAA